MYKILVLLSHYNGHEFIKSQIHSILMQRNVKVTLLIRDDGSNNMEDVEYLKNTIDGYSNIELICGENLGCAESFKSLLLEANKRAECYDYFAFSDQDDVWLEDKLLVAAKALDKIGYIGPELYCANLSLVDKKLKCIGVMNTKTFNVQKKKLASFVDNIATGCTVVFNRDLLRFFVDSVPSQMRMHDSWLYVVCSYFGEVYYDEIPHILYRQHGNNVEGTAIGYISFFKRKIKNWYNGSRAYNTAKVFLECYGDKLDVKSKNDIKLLANYNVSLSNKFNLLFTLNKNGLKRDSLFLNFILILRILFNKL